MKVNEIVNFYRRYIIQNYVLATPVHHTFMFTCKNSIFLQNKSSNLKDKNSSKISCNF